MRQIVQDLKNGKTILEEIPAPVVQPGKVLIRTRTTLVSLGTERMLVEFAKANLLEKARKQPEKVKMVLGKVKAEGLKPTVEAVFRKLGEPLPLGYCNAGEVIGVGQGVKEFKIGFTVIGAIGLQGIRLLSPTLGETVVVTGLGLIGLITAELLLANGCKVIGIDLDEQKLKHAQSKGITTFNPSGGKSPVDFVLEQTKGVGADGVIITASAKTDDLIAQAANMSRKRGKVILVGVIGLNLNRSDFFEKEITFQVSCSYGPGRYDPDYENKGQDYPIGFVRWTEKRNFEAVLEAIRSERLDVASLISERVPLKDYQNIYGSMNAGNRIASLIKFESEEEPKSSVAINEKSFAGSKGVMSIIGAGNFTRATMLPALKKAGAEMKYIVSAGGLNAGMLAKKFNIGVSSTDYHECLNDPDTDLVLITTRHNAHASMVLDALEADKHVFVEKPLALSRGDLERIEQKAKASNKTLTVGFNRRFSPHVLKMQQLVPASAPKNITMVMNAGHIPAESWVQDMEIGGGRIIGEACHFLDLAIALSGSKIASVCMNALGSHPQENTDNATILARCENGDNVTVHYYSNGHRSYSKERIEIYSQGKTLILDNFRKLTGYGFKGFSSLKTSLDKGHNTQFKLLKQRIAEGGEALIPLDQILNSASASFGAIESLKSGSWVKII